MSDNSNPFIRLEDAGVAPILRYDIPEPTSYDGRNLFEIDLPAEDFLPKALETPDDDIDGGPIGDLPVSAIAEEIVRAVRAGTSRRIGLPTTRPGARPLDILVGAATVATTDDEARDDSIATIDPEALALRLQSGERMVVYRTLHGDTSVATAPAPEKAEPHLYLIETYRLSSFLGDYGAGRIVKTLSLLPGEKTRISVKTFRQQESTRKSSSSVLDSFTKESAEDLEDSLQSEQSDQKSYAKTFEYHAEAEAKASWGWGSAKVSGGVKGGTNSTREESVKNISNAVRKHTSKASAKREVEINSNFEVSEKEGQEFSIEREIENINLSRTLNFVFRQMNQEFFTILHLTDVRVAFFNGFRQSRREVALSDIDRLIEEYIVEARRDDVKSDILLQLENIRDFEGNLRNVIRQVDLGGGDTYVQFDSGLTSTQSFAERSFTVLGPILAVDRYVMRTEGVIVEALLGEGPALDVYATQLQELEVARREEEVAYEAAKTERSQLLNQVVRDADSERAKLLADLTCPCGGNYGPSGVNATPGTVSPPAPAPGGGNP